jgi:hypothetical protein
MNTDPFAIPMLFCRVAWMDHYEGVGSDTMSGGGAYVAEHGFGHEMFNFQRFQDAVYGFVQPSGGRKDNWEEARINLPRLGASSSDNSMTGVFVVWVATAPAGGSFIVGWYRNVTVYRDHQTAPVGSNRRHGDINCGYYIVARSMDAVLLPPDERVVAVPRGGGGIGQSNIWYADDQEQHWQFRLEVLEYANTRQRPTSAPIAGGARQPDPLLRQRVEEAAVRTTSAYFDSLGYRVDSVERDNLGWDLEAALGQRLLRLEVKGLSGPQIVVDLTLNEYAAMQEYRDSYRVCVVTNAIADPCLEVFSYSAETDRWQNPAGRVLNIQEIVAARCSCSDG